MRLLAIIAVLLIVSVAPNPAPASGNSFATGPAVTAAATWLAVVDAGGFLRSWEEAAGLLKNAVPRSGWQRLLRGARMPLGEVRRRTLKSAEAATTLPGAPGGAYVVITYDTVFSGKSSARETVTTHREADGRWRIAGYFIK